MKKTYKGKQSTGGSGLIPEGDYKVKITCDEWKQNKAKTGHYLNVEFTSADKKAGKRKFWIMYNFDNQNEEAVRIANEQFENLLFCVLGEEDFVMDSKKPTIKKLHGRILMAHIVQKFATKKEKKKGWEDKNEISYLFPLKSKKDVSF